MSAWVVLIKACDQTVRRVEIDGSKIEMCESGQLHIYQKDAWQNEEVAATFYRPLAAWDSYHGREPMSTISPQEIIDLAVQLDTQPGVAEGDDGIWRVPIPVDLIGEVVELLRKLAEDY